MEQEQYYRVMDILVSAGVDECDNPIDRPRVEIHLMSYPVLARTAKGVWLDVYGSKRFARAGARKQFACATVEQAKVSFVARKKRQESLLRWQAKRAAQAKALAWMLTAAQPVVGQHLLLLDTPPPAA
jgi:hypothetical protein